MIDRRTAWTALGMAWGTFALTLLLALGAAMQDAIAETIVAGGRDWIRLGGGTTSRPFEGLPPGRPVRFEPDDHERLQSALPPGTRTASEFGFDGVPARTDRGRRASVRVKGVSGDWCRIRGFVPAPRDGRPLQESDSRDRLPVAILGRRIATELFGDASPVGRTLWLDGRPFVVVGRRDGRPTITNYNGDDRDKVIVPATAFMELFGARHPGQLLLQVDDPARAAAVTAAATTTLAARHRFDPTDPDAVWTFDKTLLDARVRGLTVGIRWMIAAIGTLGFLAAAVGVANVVSVLAEERQDELAVRVALGARPRQLVVGRLAEALAVTVAGGLLGIAMSTGLFALLDTLALPEEVRAYLGRPHLDVPTALLLLAGLAAAGIAAGVEPARRAARTDPSILLRDA